MNIGEIRKDFPVLERRDGGKPIVYLDSTATSLKPMQVIEAELDYYKNRTANIHRGLHKMSEESSRLYEEAHKKVARFVNAGSEKETVFVRNATEAMNMIAYCLWLEGTLKKGDRVLVSRLEHHANLVPWQFLERKVGIELDFVELDDDKCISLNDLEEKLEKGGVKIVSLSHGSNTLGSLLDAKKSAKLAHKKGALFALDAAQSVPHMQVNMREIDCDFAAFSGHKMLGPTGIGVLYGKKGLLEKMPPFLYGGDMIREVKWHESKWNDLPYKFEAGTPAIAQGIGLGAAVDYLQKIGMKGVREHEKEITQYCLEKMGGIGGISTYGPADLDKRGGVIVFDSEKISSHDLALALDETANVAIRSGMHCAEPIVSGINPNGLARASFYVYTTKQDIDVFADALKKIVRAFG